MNPKLPQYKIGDIVEIIDHPLGICESSHCVDFTEGMISLIGHKEAISSVNTVSYRLSNLNYNFSPCMIKLATVQRFNCHLCKNKTRNVRGPIWEEGKVIRLCKKCFDSKTFRCAICRYSHVKLYKVQTYKVCADCYKRRSKCTGCKRVGFDYSKCSTCMKRYCYDCNESDLHACRLDYETQEVCDTKIRHSSDMGKTFKINRFIGCELEVESGRRGKLFKLLDKDCGIEGDGSLVNGTEVQTPPRRLKEAENMIRNTCKALKKAGFKTTNRCGLHVHIDLSDKRRNFKAIGNLFRTFYEIEDVIYASLHSSRRDNTYCNPLKKGYDFSQVKEKISKSELLKTYYKSEDMDYIKSEFYGKGCNVRYNGLNLHSIMYRGTIEFRYHEGTINANEIIHWTHFLLQVIDYAVNHYNHEQIVKLNSETPYNKLKLMRKFLIDNKTTRYLKKRLAINFPKFKAWKPRGGLCAAY